MMRSKPQTLDSQRRTPRQSRALDTVEVIFEATARILQEEGRRGFTTNRIAERAGVSIGTLYQYFGNKQAILLAMEERESKSVHAAVVKALSGSSRDRHVEPERLAIRAFLKAYGGRYKLRRAILETLVGAGRTAAVGKLVEEVAQLLGVTAEPAEAGRQKPVSPASLFVVTRAVIGVIRSAILEESPLLGTRELEDELHRLVQAYLAQLRA